MNFPPLGYYNTAEYSFTPKGIDIAKEKEDYLCDAVNLEFEGECQSRRPRRLALPFSQKADQVITVNERAFIRVGNILKELAPSGDGGFKFLEEIKLTEYADPTDRTVAELGGSLYIFPDNIEVSSKVAKWKSIPNDFFINERVPFISANGLYLNIDSSKGPIFDDAEGISVGTKFSFSWCSSEEFTVTKKERVETKGEEGNVLNGYNVWFDEKVPYWTSFHSNPKVVYGNEAVRPMAYPFVFGYGEVGYQFSGNIVEFDYADSSKIIVDSPAEHLHVGQLVEITSSINGVNNQTAIIVNFLENGIEFDRGFSDLTSEEGEILKIKPVFPKGDFAFAYGDRLWLADNEEKRLWSSAENKPCLFYNGGSEEADSYSIPLSRKITALFDYKNQLYCFHESGCTKIYGSNTLNFLPTFINVGGIPSGYDKTVGEIGDTLYYLSGTGMSKLNGSFTKFIPSRITVSKNISCLAEGGKYYALCKDRVWVYTPESGDWHCEDGKGVKKLFFCLGKRCYLKDEGIYIANGTDFKVQWSLTTHSIFERATIFPMKLGVRLYSDQGAELEIFISKDGGEFKKLKSVAHKGQGIAFATLPQSGCNEFKIRICGEGDISIQNIFVKYRRK